MSWRKTAKRAEKGFGIELAGTCLLHGRAKGDGSGDEQQHIALQRPVGIAHLQAAGDDHQKGGRQGTGHDVGNAQGGGADHADKVDDRPPGLALMDQFFIDIFNDDIFRAGADRFQFAFMTPDKQNITGLQTDIMDLPFRQMQVGAFDGDDVDIGVLGEMCAVELLAAQGRVGGDDQFHDDWRVFLCAENQILFRRRQLHLFIVQDGHQVIERALHQQDIFCGDGQLHPVGW